MAAPVTTVGDASSVSLTIDSTKVERVFRAVPKAGYFWMRNYLGQILGRHRKSWLASKGTQFGRGAAGVKVHQVNAGPAAPGPKDVAYRVDPPDARASSPAAARDMLQRLRAEVFTGSVVLPVHEFGKDINISRWMAIPVKTRPGSPSEWKRRHPDKQLIAKRSRRDSKVLVYEVQKVGRRGRPRKGEPRPTTTRLRLRFLLTKHVDMRPTLNLYHSWDALRSDRDQLWAATATRMLKDLENPSPRDL